MTDRFGQLRIDQEIIAGLVTNGARILDLGCGDGLLLEYLMNTKEASCLGVEIAPDGVHSCIQRGVPVYHGDIDQGLSEHQDDAFDYVILSHTLQATMRPRYVLEEMLRVGKKGIVSFPNFGHWWVRRELLLHGRMPRTPQLPHTWYETPNIHICTIRDFVELCREMEIKILRQIPLASTGTLPSGFFKKQFSRLLVPMALANLIAPMAVFLVEEKHNRSPAAKEGRS